MKSEFCILLFALVGHIQASITYEDELIAEFELFKVVHEKSYDDDSEEQLRLQIFKDNKELIDRHNERYFAGEESYYMGVNQFTDMTSWEFQQLVLTPLNISTHVEYMYMPSQVELPGSVDWRAKGAVTGVKNQGRCGSCWSFAAAGALESQWYLKTKQLIPLSEQNLMDCSRRYNNHGCNGGWPASALLYVKDNGGIDVESAYPYEGHDGHCRFKRNKIGAKVSAVMQVRPDEEALAHAVAEKGPIAVAVDARNFQHYRGGIFNDRNCNKQVNHAVIVVGYGSDYWLIKNSWGGWGEQGYMRLARNHNNMCHVATYGVFPIV
ncbi:procathepsin L-like [Drosophila sulfurigaster albostrigata]|uniref:procathepsin L-like n=1 Tax=Drosophila sulfurigaster albostrigata TaxID=89887 RepID=UPI002D21B244|nr:procathepsin L-like [Drosophila sulfurigaster albostrigata]